MHSDVIKKLIVLLSFKNKDNPKVMNFRNLIVHKGVPETLLVYLYNYLYKSDSSSIVDLSYEDGKIILEEVHTFDENERRKKSIIEENKGLGDIKRTTAIIGINRDKSVVTKKQVHYSLSGCIDLIILETDTAKGSYSGDLSILTGNIMSNCNYNKICFLSSKDPSLRVYKMFVQSEEGFKESLVYLDNDHLIPCEGKLIPSENVTEDTRDSMKNIMELYGNEEIIMNPNKPGVPIISTTDFDLSSYFESISPKQ